MWSLWRLRALRALRASHALNPSLAVELLIVQALLLHTEMASFSASILLRSPLLLRGVAGTLA